MMSVAADVNTGLQDSTPTSPSSRHLPPHSLHRSLTATSRKPLRSSPLAGPAVVSLNDPPHDAPDPSPDALTPPASLHLRSKSKSAQTLARPVSLYTNYSFDHTVGNSRSGHRRRPSTAPGPETDISTSRKRFSLASPVADPYFDIHVPRRPSSVLVSLREGDAGQDPDVRPRLQPSVDIPDRGSPALSGRSNGSHLRVPDSQFSSADSSGGARVRYSYASSAAGPSNRPVSFVIGGDSDAEGETRQSRRTSYQSATPKPILKHPNSRSSFFDPSSTSTSPSGSLSSSPTSTKSNSAGSEAGPSSAPVTTRLPASLKDNSWYTFSPYATTPKFSRLGLGAPGVVMPISAKELARRKTGLSRSASLRAAKQSPSTITGKNVARRTSLATRKPSPTRASTSASTNVDPGDEAPTPAWLSVPPPARGEHRSSNRVRSRTSQGSLHDRSHGLSPSSSLARSATSSAASSTSSLRSSSGFGRKDGSWTSTAASTPLSSPSSSISLRSWKSVKASLNSMASPIALQPLTRAFSTSDITAQSVAQDKDIPSLAEQSMAHSQNDHDNPQIARELAEGHVHHRCESASFSPVRRRKSASGLLARVRSWRWRRSTAASSTGEGNTVDIVTARLSGSSVTAAMLEVEHADATMEGNATVVAVACPDNGDLTSTQASPSTSTCEHDADDEGEEEAEEKVGGGQEDTVMGAKAINNLEDAGNDDGFHSPASSFSLLDLDPEPATTAATLIVIPIPSPNLHVADNVPSFVQQPALCSEIEETLRDEVDVAPAYRVNHGTKDVRDYTLPNAHLPATEASTPDEPSAFSTTPNEVTLSVREKRSGSMQKLLNIIVCGACVAGPGSPTGLACATVVSTSGKAP